MPSTLSSSEPITTNLTGSRPLLLGLGNNKLSKFTLTVLLVSAILLGLVSGVLWSAGSLVQELVIAEAHKQGVALSIKKLSPGVFTSNVQSVRALFRKTVFPFDVVVDELSVKPSYLALFAGSFKLQANALLYDGSVDAQIGSTLSNSPMSSLSIEGVVKAVQLAKHPLLAGLGISGGEINGTVEKMVIDNGQVSKASAILGINGFAFPNALHIPATMTGLGLPLTIPALTKATISARVVVEETRLHVRELIADTSWGLIKGNISSGIVASDTQGLSGELQISLSADGTRHFGSFLPLLSQNQLKSSDSAFTVLFRDKITQTKFIPQTTAK
jgi:hypothetical protein